MQQMQIAEVLGGGWHRSSSFVGSEFYWGSSTCWGSPASVAVPLVLLPRRAVGGRPEGRWSDPLREAASRLPNAPRPWDGRPTKKPPDAWGVRGLAGRSARALEEALELPAPHRM